MPDWPYSYFLKLITREGSQFVGRKEEEEREREVGDNSAFVTKLTETCRLFTNHLLTESATAGTEHV